MTPTSRALAECKRCGWLACVVEKWIPQTRQRKDAFGFGDVLVLDGQPGALLVQVTSDANVAARAAKIRGACRKNAAAWLAAGNRIQVWGYGKRGKRGKRKLWTLKKGGRDMARHRVDRDPPNREWHQLIEAQAKRRGVSQAEAEAQWQRDYQGEWQQAARAGAAAPIRRSTAPLAQAGPQTGVVVRQGEVEVTLSVEQIHQMLQFVNEQQRAAGESDRKHQLDAVDALVPQPVQRSAEYDYTKKRWQAWAAENVESRQPSAVAAAPDVRPQLTLCCQSQYDIHE